MNGKISKLIRKVTKTLEYPKQRMKNVWNNTPKNKRGKLRENLNKELSEV